MSPFSRWEPNRKKLPKVTHPGCSKLELGLLIFSPELFTLNIILKTNTFQIAFLHTHIDLRTLFLFCFLLHSQC